MKKKFYRVTYDEHSVYDMFSTQTDTEKKDFVSKKQALEFANSKVCKNNWPRTNIQVFEMREIEWDA